MNKPQDFDTTQEFSTFTALEPGGYVCRIVQVQETTSQKGQPMLKIGLEIAEGPRKGFYAEMFKNDSRADKKWPCVVNQLVYDPNGGNTTNRGFKTFVTCVEKSNAGFKPMWGDKFCDCFKNKLIGGVFRREQYKGNDGKLHFSTKCAWFRSVEEIKAGVPVPEDKLLDNVPQSIDVSVDIPVPPAPPMDLSGYEEVIPDNALPF